MCACNSSEKEGMLYPIDSLVTAQIQELSAVHARLQKEAVLGETADSISYTPGDSLNWAKELDIFKQLNIINKPINYHTYRVEDGIQDSSSNLTVKSFVNTTNVPVRFLRVYYQLSIDKPRKIEASYVEKSTLYVSERLLNLEFSQINNKTILTSYSISGAQKIILADSVPFLIKGKIFID